MGRRRRIHTEAEIEEQRARAEENMAYHRSAPTESAPAVAPHTQVAMDAAMRHFESYATDVLRVDPSSIWLDLCSGSEQAQMYCRCYLEHYVADSVQKFVTLGPEEFEYRRTVNTANSVLSIWRRLIAAADGTVLRKKRAEDPNRYKYWTLSYNEREGQAGRSHISNVTKWLWHELPEKFDGFEKISSYKKIEATADDVLAVLMALWQRSDDIPCKQSTRISFHAITLMAAIGGFRIGCLLRILYRDVAISLVRGPDGHQKKLVVTIRVWQNKLKRAATDPRTIESISFSVTLVPHQLACVASLFTAQALKDDAFDPPFASTEELFSRPILEHTNCLRLRWKDSVLNTPMFHISDTRFHQIWARTCLVSGLRELPRFYVLRVGAGARLDGVLSEALRGYIMSNTAAVFQKSYQSHHVRENLVSLAFGASAGNDDELFKNLRNMHLRSDACAPVNLSAAEMAEFESRTDMKELRFLERQGSHTTAREARKHLQNTLFKLKLQQKRATYFKVVDDLRARGLPTTDVMAQSSSMERARLREPSTIPLARSFQQRASDADNDNVDARYSKNYIELLVATLGHGYRDVEMISPPVDDNKCSTKPVSTCLLGCGDFSSRSTLTKHYKSMHVAKGTFDKIFSCPVRLPHGSCHASIESASAWSRHVETSHGRIHAPNLFTISKPAAVRDTCLLCCALFTRGRGMSIHIRACHIDKQKLFEQPFACPACIRQDNSVKQIDGPTAWRNHVAASHAEDAADWTGMFKPSQLSPKQNEERVARKRKQHGDDSEPELQLIDPQLLLEDHVGHWKRTRLLA